MTREEVLARIAKGEEYLERTDLTPEQREAAEKRYSELVAMLEKMPEPPKEPDYSKVDPKVLECINKIRSTLGIPLRQGKAG